MANVQPVQQINVPPPPPPDETPFWTDRDQMALSGAVRTRLEGEGLQIIADFADFKDDQLKQAFKNMRTSIPPTQGVAEVLDANGTVVFPAIQPVPPMPGLNVSAKCMLRLKVASLAYHYYVSIQRPFTVANMHYMNVLKGFYVEWEAIEKLSDETKPDVPKLTKHQTPIRWVESFKDCAFRTFGVRGAPLSYVIRDNDTVKADFEDPLSFGRAYGSSGSVMQELIDRINHTDPLFKTDNGTVYSMLEVASRATIYATTIKPFSRNKDGRGAWKAMLSSHVGDDKWEQLQRDKLKFLMNTKWNGKSYSLEKFLGQHRSAYVQLEEAAMHVNIQLPTPHTRVGYLLDNISHNDPDLRAALSSIRINTDNMRDDFEKCVSFLLPVCPYAKNKTSSSRNPRLPNVSSTVLKNASDSKTGVDFRWHTHKEYSKLSKAQKQELRDWQNSKEGQMQIEKYHEDKRRKNSQNNNNNYMTKKQLQAKIKSLEAKNVTDNTLDNEIAAYVSAAMAEVDEFKNKEKNEKKVTFSTVNDDREKTFKIASQMVQKILKRKRGEED